MSSVSGSGSGSGSELSRQPSRYMDHSESVPQTALNIKQGRVKRKPISVSTPVVVAPSVPTPRVAQDDLADAPFSNIGRLSSPYPGKFTKTPFSKLNGYIYIFTVISCLGILLSIAFISFLWLSWDNNRLMHAIADQNWIPQAITLAAVVLRTSASFQATVASSMLASLSLERVEVPFENLAMFSTMRANSPGPYALAWHINSALFTHLKVKTRALVPVLIAALALSTFALQFVSTILLADVNTGIVTGNTFSSNLSTSMISDDTGGFGRLPSGDEHPWQSTPAQFPAFAEYRERNTTYVGDGIVDTGPSLRAFLPLTDASQRSTVQRYNGKATVVDTRTVCMRPDVKDLTNINAVAASSHPDATIGGLFTIPQNYRQRPTTAQNGISWRLQDYSLKRAINCSLGDGTLLDMYHDRDWQITLCQIPAVGFLVPEFDDMDIDHTDDLGNNYLAINHTFSSDGGFIDGFLKSPPIRNETDGEWIHLYYLPETYLGVGPPSSEYRVSISLCFTAFSGINSPIRATSSGNRTEPSPKSVGFNYRFDDIRQQLGQTASLTNTERGVLDLAADNWIIRKAEAHSTLDFLNDASKFNNGYGVSMSIFFQTLATAGTQTDKTFAMLFQEILTTGGGITFAIQSAMTMIGSMAYYNRLPLFNSTSEVNQTHFQTRQIPGGKPIYVSAPAGFLPGYTSVMSLVTFHCILIAVISWLFFAQTSISSLYNSWQSVAQLQGTPTVAYLADASLVDDSEVMKWIERDGYRNKLVGIQKSPEGENTEIYGLRRRVTENGHGSGGGGIIPETSIRRDSDEV